MAEFDWNSGTRAGAGDWASAVNWSPTGVPGPVDTARFRGAETVSGVGQAAAVALDLGAVLTIAQGASLTVATLDFNQLVFGIGSLVVAGSLTTGAVDLVYGAVTVAGPGAVWSALLPVELGSGLAGPVSPADISARGPVVSSVNVGAGGTFTGDLVIVDGGRLDVSSGGKIDGLIEMHGGYIQAADPVAGRITDFASNVILDYLGTGRFVSGTDLVPANSVLTRKGADLVLSGTLQGYGSLTIAGDGTIEVLNPGGVYLEVADTASPVVSLGVGGRIYNGAGSDTIYAAGGDNVWSGTGTLTFIGSGGRDTVYAPQGGGVLFAGTGGGSFLSTSVSATTLVGGGSGDYLSAYGQPGAVLIAGAGPETLTGYGYYYYYNNAPPSDQPTMYFGGSGPNYINPNSGPSVVVAGTGPETITGGTAIFLSSGAALVDLPYNVSSFVEAGTGATTITAPDYTSTAYYNGYYYYQQYYYTSPGGIIVEFTKGSAGGNDLIRNFTPERDHLALRGYGADAVAKAVGGQVSSMGNTVVTLPDNTVITLTGVSTLTADSFL